MNKVCFLFFLNLIYSKENICEKIDKKFEIKYEEFIKTIKQFIKEEEYEEAIERIDEFIIENLSISDEQYIFLRIFKIDLYFLSNALEEAINLCAITLSNEKTLLNYKTKLTKRLFLFYYYKIISEKMSYTKIDFLNNAYIEQDSYKDKIFDEIIKKYYTSLKQFKEELLIEELISYTESTEDINFILNYISECNKEPSLLKDPVFLYCFAYYLILYNIYTFEQLQDLIDEISVENNHNNKYYNLLLNLKNLNK